MAPEEVTQTQSRKRSRSETEDGGVQASSDANAGAVGEEGKYALILVDLLSLNA